MRKSIVSLLPLFVLVLTGCALSTSSPPTAAGGKRGGPPAPPAEASGKAADLKAPDAGALIINPENSKIEFVGTKPDGKHDGGFKTFLGGITLPGDDVSAAKISVDIDASSLYADDPKLTGHLKSPDFFDVKTHPKASFTSTQIKAGASGDATHTITGDLTFHGVTKPVTLPAKITLSPDALGLTSEFKISRKEFGMTYGQGKVDDPVTIKVSVKSPRK